MVDFMYKKPDLTNYKALCEYIDALEKYCRDCERKAKLYNSICGMLGFMIDDIKKMTDDIKKEEN